MNAPRAHTSLPKRGGGILFEVVLALALFGGAAAFTLGAVRSVFDSFDEMRRREEAVDLARTKIAELEAGLVTLSDLRSGIVEPASGAARHAWTFDLKTHRTAFTGLTLVELTVREDAASRGQPAEANPVSFTLRQLVALRESDVPDYEQDDMTAAPRGRKQ